MLASYLVTLLEETADKSSANLRLATLRWTNQAHFVVFVYFLVHRGQNIKVFVGDQHLKNELNKNKP